MTLASSCAPSGEDEQGPLFPVKIIRDDHAMEVIRNYQITACSLIVPGEEKMGVRNLERRCVAVIRQGIEVETDGFHVRRAG